MTLNQYIQSVQKLLQDDQFDPSVITDSLNWFVYELANNNRLRIFEDSDTLEAYLGDTFVEFPEDLLAWTSIYVTSPRAYNVGDYELAYNTFMERHAGFASQKPVELREWTPFGTGMRFAAPLDTDHSFQIDYVREPIPMKRPNDTCEIPDRYSELISKGALARVMEVNEDYSEAVQERVNLEPLRIAFIRNEARGGGKTRPNVIRTGRRRRGVQ